jgi:signal transduction histidine kinase
VKEVVDNIQLGDAEHVIRIEGQANTDVLADRGRIQQVMNNFLLNAIKYSPGATKVDVKIYTENGSVVVAVTDYGQGIPEEKIPHVFERYYRAHETKKIEGLGLGLFLCKKIIDAHNGRVWIKSKVNEGSTFYFSVPV